MAVKFYNRAKMTTATTGTGTATLGSAVTGYNTFATAGAVNSDSVRYLIEDGAAWEIGTGTYTSSGTTLTRVLVESSSGALLNLSGSATVAIIASAADIAQLDSPTFTGTPAAPTASAHTDTTQLATTSFAKTETKRVQQNAQTGTTYGPVASDAGKMVTLSNASAITVTVSSATHTAEDRIDFCQKGAGQVTFVGSGVTINSRNGLKLAGQYAGATLWFESSTVAYLFGDLTA